MLVFRDMLTDDELILTDRVISVKSDSSHTIGVEFGSKACAIATNQFT